MLNYKEPQIKHVEPFIMTTVPDEFYTTAVGAGVTTFNGAGVKNGRVVLNTGTVANDNAGIWSNIKFKLEAWQKVEFSVKGLKLSHSNPAVLSYFWGLRYDSSNVIRFNQVATGQIQAFNRNATDAVTTNLAFDPVLRRNYKIVMTPTKVKYYINNILVATHTTYIPPSNLLLQMYILVQTLDTTAKTLEFNEIEFIFE